MNKKVSVGLLATLLWAAPGHAERLQIEIVGSPMIYPLAKRVAERFDQNEPSPDPVITATHTNTGIARFCDGSGLDTPDIAMAARPMTPAEAQRCAENDVTDILTIKIGYDALTLGTLGWPSQQNLDRRDLFLGLAAQVPDANGDSLIDNPYQTWQQINPALPNLPIKVFAPDATHDAYTLFAEETLQVGCEQFSLIARLKYDDPNRFAAICTTPRKDGRFVASGDYNTVLRELQADPEALGVLAATFVMHANLKTVAIDHDEPTLSAIVHQTYPLAHTLELYVKRNHLRQVPGLARYIDEFTSETAWGTRNAYLSSDSLMVPMTLSERRTARNEVEAVLQSYVKDYRISKNGQPSSEQAQ